jgi:hypothetical protein
VLAGRDGEQCGHRSLGREIGETTPTLPEAKAGVDEQQPDDVARAGEREPAEGMAVQSGRAALAQRERAR